MQNLRRNMGLCNSITHGYEPRQGVAAGFFTAFKLIVV